MANERNNPGHPKGQRRTNFVRCFARLGGMSVIDSPHEAVRKFGHALPPPGTFHVYAMMLQRFSQGETGSAMK